MQINLKQNEIVEAIQQYVAKQGINLVGRRVEVSFTAGRGKTGLSADVAIEDAADLPDFGLENDETKAAVALSVVKSEPVAADAQEMSETPATKSLFA